MVQSHANLSPEKPRVVAGGLPATTKFTDPSIAWLTQLVGNRGGLSSAFGLAPSVVHGATGRRSLELPETVVAEPRNELRPESPTPFWYDETAQGPWGRWTGVFLIAASHRADPIDSMAGKPGASFFALPGVALFQDYRSTSGTNTTPAHDFKTRFEGGGAGGLGRSAIPFAQALGAGTVFAVDINPRKPGAHR